MNGYPEGLLGALGINPEDLRRQSMTQGLLSAGLQMLAASGPSPVRQSLGQIVAQGGLAGMQGMQQAEESAIDRALKNLQLQSTLAQQRQAQEAAQRQSQAVAGLRAATQPVTAQTALSMPGRVGPTPERQAMVGQTPQMTRDQALQLALNPDLPKDMRESLFKYVETTAPPKEPEAITTLRTLANDPTLAAYDIARKQAGAAQVTMPKITIDMGNKFGGTLDTTLTKIVDGGFNSRSVLPTVETMSALLDEGIRTGFGQETFMKLNQAAQLFNPNFKAKEVAGQEAFIALGNEIILPQVKQLGVNPTDADLNFIRNGSPTLSKSVEGNKLLLDALNIKLQRDAVLQDFAIDWQSRNVSLIEQSPVRANTELRREMLELTKTHPLWTQASNELRSRYSNIVNRPASSQLPANNPFIRPR